MNEDLGRLRVGFEFSSVTIVLLMSYVVLMSTGLIMVVGFALPILFALIILFVWVSGFVKRVGAWNILGQGMALPVSLFGVILFLLVFPISKLLLWGIIHMFGFPFSLVDLASIVSWGAYTFIESRGMKSLEERYALDLKLSRIFSLTGVLVCLLVFVGLEYFGWYFFWLLDFVGYPSTLEYAFLLAGPFLIASCFFSVKGLKGQRTNSPQ
jgi:hypothetical protein